MSKGYGWILTVFVCAVALAQQPPPPPTPAPTRDHFKFWKVVSVPVDESVQLLGQFDGETWWEASVDSIEYVGNPTRKNYRNTITLITDPDLHLVAYSITPALGQPRRTVVIENQLGFVVGSINSWTLGDPELLLVPAGKTFSPTVAKRPARGDHFVCYAVVEPRLLYRELTLNDQFDMRRQTAEQITELEPAYFCVPARKRHGRAVAQPLVDATTHLAIYRIRPITVLPLRTRFQVSTADQFGTRTLRVRGSRMLAVPTIKSSWERKIIFRPAEK